MGKKYAIKIGEVRVVSDEPISAQDRRNVIKAASLPRDKLGKFEVVCVLDKAE